MNSHERQLINTLRAALWMTALVLSLMFLGLLLLLVPPEKWEVLMAEEKPIEPPADWIAPDSLSIPSTPEGELIRYGYELVAHTSAYLGPSGSIAPVANGMNCQNCHLNAGKKHRGNNFSAVASTYPKFRSRSGKIETIERRVNDCFERSLNGSAIAEGSNEMTAIVAYIKWVGKDVPKGTVPKSAGIADLPFLKRAADQKIGAKVFADRCSRCHGPEGEGMPKPGANEWLYPPLWGDHSFNKGAGLYRLSRLAGFIQINMPFDTLDARGKLTTEEAWDVAAYICSKPRPSTDLSGDWPDLNEKPMDYPFGPYADPFTEQQHKYGPFEPIIKEISRR